MFHCNIGFKSEVCHVCVIYCTQCGELKKCHTVIINPFTPELLLHLSLMHEDMYRSGMGGMDRDFGQGDLPMNRGFGSDSFGGMGESES